MANIASEAKITQRRADILGAAVEVFASKGFHAAGVADIAKTLNIGHGTIYRYFKNKRDIFNAILAGLLGEMAEVVQQEPPTTDSLDEYQGQLERIADHLMRIFNRDTRLAKIAFYESIGAGGEIRESAEHFVSIFAQFTEQYMKNGVNKGFLRPSMDQKVAANLVTSMLMEAVKQVAMGQYSDDEMQRWRGEITQFVIGGLGVVK